MKYLSDYMNARQTELFNETGAFFAFSQSQFDDKRREGVNYITLGSGLICPQDNVKQLEKGLSDILTWAIHQDVSENGVDRIVEREYFNYETHITMNNTDAMRALTDHIRLYPDLFTPERINKVMKACFDLAVEKDYF